MTEADRLFLAVLAAALCGKAFEGDLTAEAAAPLLHTAQIHAVLPLVTEAIFRRKELLRNEALKDARKSSVQQAIQQITKQNDFLSILLRAQERGLDPIVVKGAVCRSLYPKPVLRPSLDEDILVPPGQMAALHAFLLGEGLAPDDPDADPEKDHEISYRRADLPTYIELHSMLFSPENEAYRNMNALFADVFERTARVRIEDVSVRTLSPGDHMLYLLCHAYKHFLHSGVGIRQVCDIAMTAAKCGDDISWDQVFKKCETVRMERFAAALFAIADKYLGFPMPEAFSRVRVNETDLLQDILTGGLYGIDDIDRLHSAAITLEAVAAERRGKRKGSLMAAAFPQRRALEGRYPYLRKKPWLLPVAWCQRIAGYVFRNNDPAKVHPGRSIRIGQERVALLKEYGIID